MTGSTTNRVRSSEAWDASTSDPGAEVVQKIAALYARGMNREAISKYLAARHLGEPAPAAFAHVSRQLQRELSDWQSRPLASHYPLIWFEIVRVRVSVGARPRRLQVCTPLGVDLTGRREVLGLYTGADIDTAFWASVLHDFHSRGIADLLIACAEDRSGFDEALNNAYPKGRVQQCMVQQVRRSLQLVVTRDRLEVERALRGIIEAPNRDGADAALQRLISDWGERYPLVCESWQSRWSELARLYDYAPEIRRALCTRRSVEALHRQFRRLNLERTVFDQPVDLAVTLFLAARNASRKWTLPVRNWNLVLSQFASCFAGRLDDVLPL